jgi:uncharacterized protein (DUF58 family)
VLAKTDRLYLKQYIEETNLNLICLVDASESMGFGTVKGDGGETWTKYDHATAIAAGLSYLTIQQQDSVGLAIFDQALNRYFKPSNSPGQWKIITQELQQVPRWNKTNTGKILDQLAEKLNHRSLIVILSDFFDDLDGLRKGLQHLRYKRHEIMAFQILDPAEIEFPFDDVTLFKGLEDAGQLLTEPRSLREAYLEQLRIFTEEMQKMCRGMRIDFTRMNTAESLDVSLSAFLATRAASIK